LTTLVIAASHVVAIPLVLHLVVWLVLLLPVHVATLVSHTLHSHSTLLHWWESLTSHLIAHLITHVWVVALVHSHSLVLIHALVGHLTHAHTHSHILLLGLVESTSTSHVIHTHALASSHLWPWESLLGTGSSHALVHSSLVLSGHLLGFGESTFEMTLPLLAFDISGGDEVIDSGLKIGDIVRKLLVERETFLGMVGHIVQDSNGRGHLLKLHLSLSRVASLPLAIDLLGQFRYIIKRCLGVFHLWKGK